MSNTQKPTYEELAKGILLLEEGWNDLFGQVCSNPVQNAWGQPVDFTAINLAREQTCGLVYRLKKHSEQLAEDFIQKYPEYLKGSEPLVFQPETPTLQSYLSETDSPEYNMKDMLLQHFVDQERRRMSKSGETDDVRNLDSEVETRINNLEIPLVDVIEAVFGVLARVAKGDTKVE